MTPTNANSFLVKVIVIITCLILAAIGMLGFLAYTVSKQQQEVQAQAQIDDIEPVINELEEVITPVDDDKIFENISIDEIDVGGLTKEEASSKLEKALQEPLESNVLKVSLSDKEYDYPFSAFYAKYNIEEKVAEAHRYGREGSLQERESLIMKLKTTPLNLTLDYSFDDERIAEELSALAGEIDIPPTNATITRANGSFVITEGKSGVVLNKPATSAKISETLTTKTSGTVTAVMDTAEPSITSADLQNAQTLLGTYKTTFTAGQVGRNTNISTAAGKINNVNLLPNQVFSTNKHFGPTTYENGYRMANIIENGKLVEGMGGGVCQVSSTLYMAVLYSELKVVERTNHSLKVGYMDYGYDATLAGDYIDFKFQNDTPYPIIIESYISGNTITVNIYGYEVHSPNRTVKFSNKLVDTLKPAAEIVHEDPNLPSGQRSVISSARNGYKYEVYKSVYESGNLIETVLVNTSTYRATRGEVRVGTGAPVDTEKTDETIVDTPPDGEETATSEDTVPSENKPAENQPAENKPAENQPAENKPAENQPVENKPAESQPVENKPAENQPVENKPAENQPVENKPAESQPVENKPAESQPVENQPVENNAVESQPVMDSEPTDSLVPSELIMP